MLVYGRDGRLGPRLKHLFQGTFRNPETNKLTGVYEVVLKRAAMGSPGNGTLLLNDVIQREVKGVSLYGVRTKRQIYANLC